MTGVYAQKAPSWIWIETNAVDVMNSAGIVRGLLPPFVQVAEGPIDGIHGALWDAEQAHIAAAVAKRRKEFAAGRILARRVLEAMGAVSTPLLAGDDRVPLWPAGFTGSISHSTHYVAAAVARSNDVAALGVDLEDVVRFRVDLERHILSSDEITRCLVGRGAVERQASAAAMFCAKEAYYKAQYPLTGRRLGFHDVEIELDEATGAFEVWRTAGPGRRRAGAFALGDGLAAAAVWFEPGCRFDP